MTRIASLAGTAPRVALLALGIATTGLAQATTAAPRSSHHFFGTSGLYVAGDAGAAVPYGAFGDAGYDAGFHADVALGWQRPEHTVGLRALLAVDHASAARDNASRSSPRIVGVTADALFHAPLQKSADEGYGVSIYALGGGGRYLFRSVGGTPLAAVLGAAAGDRNVANWGLEVGGGVSWGIGPAALFAESRWVNVFTRGGRAGASELRWMPFALGLAVR